MPLIPITRLLPGDVVNFGGRPETVISVERTWSQEEEYFTLTTNEGARDVYISDEVDAVLAPRTPDQRLREVFEDYQDGSASWADLNAAVQAVKPEGEGDDD